MSALNTESIPTSHTNGVIEDYDEDDKSKVRPADIDADMREMKRRQRVEQIMNSRLFREELERIIESQIKAGNSSFGLLQQISDIVGSRYSFNNHINRNLNCTVPINDIRGVEAVGYGKGEKILRCKLAALFRLIDLFGWSQGIYNHVTARLSQKEEHFLVNPYGLLYSEITASSLAKVDMQGTVLEAGTTNFAVNVSGFQLHAAIYAARPDLNCIVHLHTPAVLTVSSLKDGLLPICQEAAVIGDVSQHTYIGIPNEPEERDKIARNLGPINKVIFLTNHGVLCCGKTIEETFFNVYNTVNACETQLKLLPLGKDNLVLLSDETKKTLYDSARKLLETIPPPIPNILAARKTQDGDPSTATSDGSKLRWHLGELEYEALMRMLDNAGFRTGYNYRQPLIKGEVQRPKDDVELPPAVSSLGYLLEEEELYKQGQWKKGYGTKGNDRIRWLNSPNVYQKVEILETGTTDPKKITKWIDANNEEWVAEGSPSHTSTPVKIDNALQFVPKNTNPREFKKLQQQIKDNRRADKITSGPQSHILEGVSWEEAKKLQDANISATGDQVILVGAASKGIIQREFQHNATVYKTPYAKNPFDAITDEELENYKKDITRKQRGDSYYEEDESDALSSSLPQSGKQNALGITSETEDESLTHDIQVIQTETSTVPKASHAEVVLSDDIGKKSRKSSKSQTTKAFIKDYKYRRPANVFVVRVWEMKKFYAFVSFSMTNIPRATANPSPVLVTLPAEHPKGFDSSESEYTVITEIGYDFSSTDEDEQPQSLPLPLSRDTEGATRSVSLSSLKSYIGGEFEEQKPPPLVLELPPELTSSFAAESDDTASQDEQTVIAVKGGDVCGGTVVIASSDVDDVDSIDARLSLSPISNTEEVYEISSEEEEEEEEVKGSVSGVEEADETVHISACVAEFTLFDDGNASDEASSTHSSVEESGHDYNTYQCSDYVVDSEEGFGYAMSEDENWIRVDGNANILARPLVKPLDTGLYVIPEEEVETGTDEMVTAESNSSGIPEKEDNFLKSILRFLTLKDAVLQRVNACSTFLEETATRRQSNANSRQESVADSSEYEYGFETNSSAAAIRTDYEGVATRNAENAADSDAQTISDKSMASFLADSCERINSEAALDSGILTEDSELISCASEELLEVHTQSMAKQCRGFDCDDGSSSSNRDDGFGSEECFFERRLFENTCASHGSQESFLGNDEEFGGASGVETTASVVGTDDGVREKPCFDCCEDLVGNVMRVSSSDFNGTTRCTIDENANELNTDYVRGTLKDGVMVDFQNDTYVISNVQATGTESYLEQIAGKQGSLIKHYSEDVFIGEYSFTEGQDIEVDKGYEKNMESIENNNDIGDHIPFAETTKNADPISDFAAEDKLDSNHPQSEALELIAHDMEAEAEPKPIGVERTQQLEWVEPETELMPEVTENIEPYNKEEVHPLITSSENNAVPEVTTNIQLQTAEKHYAFVGSSESNLVTEVTRSTRVQTKEERYSFVSSSEVNEDSASLKATETTNKLISEEDKELVARECATLDVHSDVYTKFPTLNPLSGHTSYEELSSNGISISDDELSMRNLFDHKDATSFGDGAYSESDHNNNVNFDCNVSFRQYHHDQSHTQSNTTPPPKKDSGGLLTVRVKWRLQMGFSGTEEPDERSFDEDSLNDSNHSTKESLSGDTDTTTSSTVSNRYPSHGRRTNAEYDYPKFVLYNYFSPKIKLYRRRSSPPILAESKVMFASPPTRGRHKACFEPLSGAYLQYSKVSGDMSFANDGKLGERWLTRGGGGNSASKSCRVKSKGNGDVFKASTPTVREKMLVAKETPVFKAENLVNTKLSPIFKSLEEFELLESILAEN